MPSERMGFKTRWRVSVQVDIITEMRCVLLTAGVTAIVGGAVLAAMPFDITIDVPIAGGQPGALCRSPLLAAWNRQPKGQLALWAVTNLNDGSVSHEVRFGADPYCARQARLRLGIAAVLMGAGLSAALLGRRTTAWVPG